MAKEIIRIIHADEQSLFRSGVKSELKNIKHLHLIAEASTGKELIALTAELKPDIVLTNVLLPELDGPSAAAIISREHPTTKIIVFTKLKEEGHILDMLNAGAIGYLLKSATKKELITAIEQVANKIPYFCQEISERITQLLTKNPGFITQHFTVHNFSVREQEIVQLICEGKTNKEMAYLLHISKRTVESHRRRIMDKIGVANTAEIITYALSRGIYIVKPGH